VDLYGAFSIADADLAFMLQRLILNDDAVPERIARYGA
jgi:glutathione S-transferase